LPLKIACLVCCFDLTVSSKWGNERLAVQATIGWTNNSGAGASFQVDALGAPFSKSLGVVHANTYRICRRRGGQRICNHGQRLGDRLEYGVRRMQSAYRLPYELVGGWKGRCCCQTTAQLNKPEAGDRAAPQLGKPCSHHEKRTGAGSRSWRWLPTRTPPLASVSGHSIPLLQSAVSRNTTPQEQPRHPAS
jgi:hypothetical protein